MDHKEFAIALPKVLATALRPVPTKVVARGQMQEYETALVMSPVRVPVTDQKYECAKGLATAPAKTMGICHVFDMALARVPAI